MAEPPNRTDATLAVAERVAAAAHELQLDTAVIDAIAMAVHG
jgi:hypothetical protein